MKKTILLLMMALLCVSFASATFTTQVAGTISSLSVASLDGADITVTITDMGDSPIGDPRSDFSGPIGEGASLLSSEVPLDYDTQYKYVLTYDGDDFTFTFTTPSAPSGGNPGYYALGTGQTGCWDVSGTPRDCENTGEDGDAYGASFARIWVDEGCGTGTVLDESTGLCWQKDDNGEHVFWQTALDYCNSFNSGESQEGELPGTGWRLPTIGEIWMMHNYQTGLRYSVFSGGTEHWSSTSLDSWHGLAIYLEYDGSIFGGDKGFNIMRARCVRFAD